MSADADSRCRKSFCARSAAVCAGRACWISLYWWNARPRANSAATVVTIAIVLVVLIKILEKGMGWAKSADFLLRSRKLLIRGIWLVQNHAGHLAGGVFHKAQSQGPILREKLGVGRHSEFVL